MKNVVINIENNYQPLINCIKKYNWEGDVTTELFQNIKVSKKNNMYLYNYNDLVLVPRNHSILVKCRGLVVKEDGTILNYSMDRFFNSWEKESISIDWESAVVEEKLDGSLICVFWNGRDWEITTRGSFYSDETAENQRFDKWFREIFSQWKKLEIKYCYIFELCSSQNKIITSYKKEFVALIGMRDLETLEDMNGHFLLLKSRQLIVKRPKTLLLDNIDEVLKYLNKCPDTFEGFVVIDKDMNRIKIKSERYLALARIKMLTTKDIFNYVIGKLEVDVEQLHVFPEVKEEVERISKIWEDYKNRAMSIYTVIDNNSISRKEFALQAINYDCKKLLFTYLDDKKPEDVVNYESVKHLFGVEKDA